MAHPLPPAMGAGALPSLSLTPSCPHMSSPLSSCPPVLPHSTLCPPRPSDGFWRLSWPAPAQCRGAAASEEWDGRWGEQVGGTTPSSFPCTSWCWCEEGDGWRNYEIVDKLAGCTLRLPGLFPGVAAGPGGPRLPPPRAPGVTTDLLIQWTIRGPSADQTHG